MVPEKGRAERLRAAIQRERALPERLFTVTIDAQAVMTLSSYK